MYNSFSFLVAHTFFRPCVARKFITVPMRLAPVGHTETHFIHEMHLAESTILGSESGIASAGHCLAQAPQRLHPRLPLGCGIMPPFLYGRWPGTCGIVQSLPSAFRIMSAPKCRSDCRSSASGLPWPYLLMMLCSATAPTAAITRKPISVATSSISIRASS